MSDHLKPKEVSRETLYDEVWSTPLTKLAVTYGVSSVALAKTCRRLAVPVPPRGHWQKLEHGKKTAPKPPLPPAKQARAVQATIRPSPPPLPRATKNPVVAELARAIEVGKNKAKVAGRLTRPHPAVVAVIAPVRRDRQMEGGRSSPTGSATLPINVSNECEPRALRIMDALAKALEGRGYAVSAAGAVIEGETVPIAMSERSDRTPHVTTAAERVEKARFGLSLVPTWDYAPNGRLVISCSAYTWWRRDLRKNWGDGRGGQLEDMLDQVLLGLIAIGFALLERAVEQKEVAARAAELARQRELERRLARIEAGRDQAIVNSAAALAEADKIRHLIDAVERLSTYPDTPLSDRAREWLVRASALAERLDPLADGIEAMLASHEEIAQKAGDAQPKPIW